jgi:fibronectin-binding autotransporter adhesin
VTDYIACINIYLKASRYPKAHRRFLMMKWTGKFLTAVAVLAGLGGGMVSAQSTFQPTVTGSWNTAGNWSPSGVPNGAGVQSIILTPTAAQSITLDAAISAGNISFTNNATTFISTLANGTGGSLTFNNGGSNATFTANGTNATTNSVTVSASVTLTDSLNLVVNNTSATNAAATFTGALTGAGGVVKSGDGNASFTTANKTYTGATVINGGALNFTATGAATGTSSITVNSGGQLRFTTNGGAYSFGSAVITLNGAGSAGPIGSPGALRSNGTGVNTLANAVILASDSAIFVNATSLQLNGVFSGSSQLTKNGLGTLIFNNAANTATGATLVTAGGITVNAASSLSTGALTLSQSTGVSTLVTLNNTSQTIGSLASVWTDSTGTLSQNLVLNGTALTINQTANTSFGPGAVGTLTSVISGTGGSLVLSASSTGTLTLSGANTYTAGTTINGGTLLANGPTSATGTGNITVNSTGKFGGTGTVSGNVTVAGGGQIQGGNGTTVGSVLSTGNVTIANNGILQAFAGNGGTASDITTTGSSKISAVNFGRSNTSDVIQIALGQDGSLVNGTQYTRRITSYSGTLQNLTTGTFTDGDVGNPFNLTGIGFTVQSGWAVVVGANGVDLVFTPVPEPTTILGLSALALGGVGYIRRRRAAAKVAV